MSENPYEPPTTAGLVVSRRLSWRHIPAAFLILYGILTSLLYIAAGAAGLYNSVSHRNEGQRSWTSSRFAGLSLLIVSSLLVLAAGFAIHERRWKRMTVCLVVGYGIGVFGSALFNVWGLP